MTLTRRSLPRASVGLGETNSQIGSQAGAVAGSFIPIPGASAVLSAIGSLIGGLFGGNTPVLTTPEIASDITPAVVNDLQNAGLTLPAGQEDAYVQAALTNQLPTQSVNYTAPLLIGGLALWLLMS